MDGGLGNPRKATKETANEKNSSRNNITSHIILNCNSKLQLGKTVIHSFSGSGRKKDAINPIRPAIQNFPAATGL